MQLRPASNPHQWEKTEVKKSRNPLQKETARLTVARLRPNSPVRGHRKEVKEWMRPEQPVEMRKETRGEYGVLS